MDIEDEYTYDTTIENIVFHLEQLISDVILTSIKRLSAEQKETVLQAPFEKKDNDKF